MPAWLTRLLLESESLLRHLPGARKPLRRTLLAGVADMNLFHEVTAHMRRMDKVFIAAINGLALGGGCELALACDLRLMAEDDQVERFLGQPEVLIGLIPGGGGTQMARSLGVARARSCAWKGNCWSRARPLRWPGQRAGASGGATGSRRRAGAPVPALTASGAPDQAFDLPGGFPRLDGGHGQRKGRLPSAASQGNTRRAMREYIERVRTIVREERPFRRADFDDLTEGNAIDMAYR